MQCDRQGEPPKIPFLKEFTQITYMRRRLEADLTAVINVATKVEYRNRIYLAAASGPPWPLIRRVNLAHKQPGAVGCKAGMGRPRGLGPIYFWLASFMFENVRADDAAQALRGAAL